MPRLEFILLYLSVSFSLSSPAGSFGSFVTYLHFASSQVPLKAASLHSISRALQKFQPSSSFVKALLKVYSSNLNLCAKRCLHADEVGISRFAAGKLFHAERSSVFHETRSALFHAPQAPTSAVCPLKRGLRSRYPNTLSARRRGYRRQGALPLCQMARAGARYTWRSCRLRGRGWSP